MKKIIFTLMLGLLITITLLIVVLSFRGIETTKFNDLISNKIPQTDNNFKIKFKSIKFRIDIKELSLFLNTKSPKISYRDKSIPIKHINVYLNFKSFFGSDSKIEKINVVFKEINVDQLKQLSSIFKPSNFKSIINNNIKEGEILADLDIYFDENNEFANFISKGTVKNLKTEIIQNTYLSKTNFTFFADKSDILIKNIFGETNFLKIIDGDIKLKIDTDIFLEANFKSNINFLNNSPKKYEYLTENFKNLRNISYLSANLTNYLSIKFDQTYKILNYKYKNSGDLISAEIKLDSPYINPLSNKKIKNLSFNNSEISSEFNNKNENFNIAGKYSVNNGNFLDFNLHRSSDKISKISNFKMNSKYNEGVKLDLINFFKKENETMDLTVDLKKSKEDLIINELELSDKKNQIIVKGLSFIKKKFTSIDKIFVKTNKNNIINNDFSIIFGKKIFIKGNNFDASLLPKVLNNSSKSDLPNLSKKVEIDFKNIIAPLSENLKNFKLIGEIERGKFSKISSKGDFGNNNFLDISMKRDKGKKKYLEIYSDLTGPLLTEYSFFKGLTGGKLIYSSIIDDSVTTSKLIIENFKVINAPGMVKLLSLADLRGLADLAEGEGLSFDLLEINMEKDKNILKLNEILALGPSISVLMEGYQDLNGLTSLRGTLVPAKTINKMISKIPIIGDIIIPKEIGEGLFGISFKMKGPTGKIKTTINPIRTLTPRFIQKIIDKKKLSNPN